MLQVIAIVKGPHEPNRRSDAVHEKGFINCEYNIAPFAGSDRKKRRLVEYCLCCMLNL
jgi:ribonuclease PH